MDKEDVFRNFLKSEGLKFTPQREMVLEEAFSAHDHFEADDLLFRMRQRGLRVSRATVYRTLALMVQCGLLRDVIFGEKHSHYEHTLGHEHHDHLVCLGCGKIIEFTDASIERFQQKVCEEQKFEPLGHKFEITGYCEDCRMDS